MSKKTFKWSLILPPLLIFAALLFLLWRGLYLRQEILPSALIGKPVPAFRLPNLLEPSRTVTEKDLQGRVTLLNVWASWCSACEMEHAMLLKIKNQYQVPIIGIDYKDNPNSAKLLLSEEGNPYTLIGEDRNGEVGMDLGVYGTPETFIVNKKGVIVYRHVGVIDERVWLNELLPLVKSQE